VTRREAEKEAEAWLEGAVLHRTMHAVDGARSVTEYTMFSTYPCARLVFMDGPGDYDERHTLVLYDYPLRNLVSLAGCGLSWFLLPRSRHDLCRTFLPRTWVPEAAAEVLLVLALEALRDAEDPRELWLPEDRAAAQARFHELDRALCDYEEDEATSVCRSELAFYSFLVQELGDDGDAATAGRDFDPDDAARLCAVQRKFAELLPALLHEERRAAEDEALAREGPQGCVVLGC
jgi:hypothetical protein